MRALSSLALHWLTYIVTSFLVDFMVSYSGPALGLPAFFQLDQACLLALHFIFKVESLMYILVDRLGLIVGIGWRRIRAHAQLR